MIKGFMPQLAEGGKIKIGRLGKILTNKDGGAWGKPEKLDHFLLTDVDKNSRTDNFRVREEVMAKLKADDDGYVRELPITVHSDDIDLIFPTAFAYYAGRRLQCSGDGEVAKEKRGREFVEVKCRCPKLTGNSPTCKPHGTLHCSLRISGEGLAGSVYKFRTTSEITIKRILGSLMQIREMVGILRGLPLMLCLRDVEVTTGVVHCAHVELREENLIEVQRQAIESAKMRASVMQAYDLKYKQLIQLPGFDESEAEQGHINDEFSPDTANEDGGSATVTMESLIEKSRASGASGAAALKQKLQSNSTGAAVPSSAPMVVATTAVEYKEPVEPSPVTAIDDRGRMFAWYESKGLSAADVLKAINRSSPDQLTDGDFTVLRTATRYGRNENGQVLLTTLKNVFAQLGKQAS